MNRITFKQYVTWRQRVDEGMWLNDDEAVEGWSKLPQPKPKQKPKPKATASTTKPVAKLEIQKPLSKKLTPGLHDG